MKEITLRIPDHKVEFVMELTEQLGLEVSDEPEIPEEHKEIVRERVRKSNKNPDRLLDWEEVKESFEFESCTKRKIIKARCTEIKPAI